MVHCSYWADNGHSPEPLVLVHLLYIQTALKKNHFPEAHHVQDSANYVVNGFHNAFLNLQSEMK